MSGYIVDDGDDLIIAADDVALDEAGDLDPLGRREEPEPTQPALPAAGDDR